MRCLYLSGCVISVLRSQCKAIVSLVEKLNLIRFSTKITHIVMKTTKGKNVSFMENNAGWHGKASNDAEREQALSELKAILAELEGK